MTAEHPNAAPPGSRYQDQRHYVVPSRLDELHGPTSGTARLESWLDWSGDAQYDLDDPGDLQVMYQTVLNEAATLDDLRRWLEQNTLRRVWPTLWLPRRLRAMWEARFPELAKPPRAMAS
jgi:hypothetical protein